MPAEVRPAGSRGRIGALAPWLLVLSLAILPYLGVLRAPFVFDDEKLVRDNPTIRDLSRIPETFNIFSRRWDDEALRANYRPLRFLSYAIDYRISRWLFGDFPAGDPPTIVFRAHNILLHALNVLLVLGIGRVLLRDRASALALALLFALHPVLTEAVTYVSGRRDVLSALFFLAALRVYLGKGARLEDRGPGGAESPPPAPVSGWALFLVPLLFILGLLSKEMVVTLPAVILALDLVRRARFGERRVVLIVLLWAIALAFTALEVLNPRLVASPAGGSRASALLTAPRYAARYLALLLFPHSQSIDYSFDAIPVSTDLLSPWTTLPSAVLILGLLGAGLVAGLRRSAYSIGLLWFLITLSPVLQIVPIPERFAERFAYLPSIGIFLAAAWTFRALHRKAPPIAWGAGGTVLAILGIAAISRNGDWKSPEALWGSAARAQPRAARAHLGYGHALRDQGRYRDAAREYTLCLQILGEIPPEALGAGSPRTVPSDELLRWGQVLQARAFRAQVYDALGGEESVQNYEKAAADYRWLLAQRDIDGSAIGESPKYLVNRWNLGRCLLGLSEAEPSKERGEDLRAGAAAEFRKIVGSGGDPGYRKGAHYYLSKIALKEGRGDECLGEMEKAFQVAQESGDALDRYRLVAELADLLIERKEYDRADGLLSASIDELKGLPEAKDLLYRRSLIADRRGDLTGAVRLLEDALARDPEFGPALLSLAGMEENRGNLERAEELYRRLLRFAPGEERALKGLQGISVRRNLEKKGGKEGAKEALSAKEEETKLFLKGLIDRGEGYFKRGELFAAAEAFRKASAAVQESPRPEKFGDLRAQALRRLAAIAGKLREFEKARSYLLEAVSADPAHHDALRDLGDLYLRDLNDRKAAEEAYREYLKALPEGKLAESWIYMNLGTLIQDRSPVEAIELFLLGKKAGIEDPGTARLADLTLGYLLAQTGKWEAALARFQEFLERSEEAAKDDLQEIADRERVRKYVEKEVIPHLEGEGGIQEDSRKDSGSSR